MGTLRPRRVNPRDDDPIDTGVRHGGVERRIVGVEVGQCGVANPAVEPRDQAVHSVLGLPFCRASVKADMASPLHVREPCESPVQRFDTRGREGKCRRNKELKRFASAHGKTVVDAL